MNSRTEQAVQLLTPVWDGDLISKPDRDALVKAGLADKVDGFNMLTRRGLKTCRMMSHETPPVILQPRHHQIPAGQGQHGMV